MKVDTLRTEQSESYDRFLLKHPCSLIYYSSKYRDFLKELLGCHDEYLIAMEGDEIRGVLPLMFIEERFGRVYNSLPYYGSNGGIIADSDEAYQLLLSAYDAIARSSSTLSSTIIGNPLAEQDCDKIRHNYLDRRIGQFMTIPSRRNSWDNLMARIDSSARRNVKKAIREGVTVEVDNAQRNVYGRYTSEPFVPMVGCRNPTTSFIWSPVTSGPGRTMIYT